MVAAAVVRGGDEVLEALALLHKRVIGGLLLLCRSSAVVWDMRGVKREKVETIIYLLRQ
jgi:hypothetical protein